MSLVAIRSKRRSKSTVKRLVRRNGAEETGKTFEKELDKLHRLNPAAAEYSVQVNYIQTLLDLPWGEYTKDNLDLKNAQSHS